jgi:hypothetical protein
LVLLDEQLDEILSDEALTEVVLMLIFEIYLNHSLAEASEDETLEREDQNSLVKI